VRGNFQYGSLLIVKIILSSIADSAYTHKLHALWLFRHVNIITERTCTLCFLVLCAESKAWYTLSPWQLSEEPKNTQGSQGRWAGVENEHAYRKCNSWKPGLVSNFLTICASVHGGDVKTERWSEHLYAVQVEGRSFSLLFFFLVKRVT